MSTPASAINQCCGVAQGPSGQAFMLLINALVSAKCELGDSSNYPKDSAKELENDEEFDFIVVGAGAAGSRLAERLSEISQWKILLIEAGGYPSSTSEIPAMATTLRFTAEDWGYNMQPTTICRGIKDQVCPCPRGKGLGGTTLINGCMYVRSTQHDHQKWVDGGNPGWDYDSMAELYRSFEDVHTEERGYGKHGDLKINPNVISNSFHESMPRAYRELGLGKYSLNKPIGFNIALNTIDNGTRQNTAKAFLTKAKNRPNLLVSLYSEVGRLVFDTNNTKVVGVEVKIKNETHTIRARNEVILAGGSINTPIILLNSGIGPKEHLSELGIEVVRDLQVGENFQDHVMLPLFLYDIKAPDLGPEPPLTRLDNMYEYFIHKSGPLVGLYLKVAGYVNTQQISNYANVQFIHTAYNQQSETLTRYLDEFEASDQIKETVRSHNQKAATAAIVITVLHPKSRGRIRLQNNDPYAPPLIEPNFLSDKNNDDLKTMLKAVRIAKRLIKTRALSKYSPRIIDLEIPDCRNRTFNSDDYWECVFINIGQTLYHPIGTCKMGPASDPTAVVDPRLRVHGIEGLRIVDGSIMPTLPSGNTNAPIILIGEKGFRLIRDDWLKPQK